MERWTGICAVLIATVVVSGALGQEVSDADAEELRLEIAHLRVALNEAQSRLEAIEKRLPAPPWDKASSATPKTALDGFCPVALVEAMAQHQPKWTYGHPDIVRIYDGLSYRFSSKSARSKFDEAPPRYAVVMQGCDSVIAKGQSRRVPGQRDYGARWQDRTYIFANRESYQAFRDSPEEYAAPALQGSLLEHKPDFRAQAWSYFSKYRPVEAWIASGLLQAGSFAAQCLEQSGLDSDSQLRNGVESDSEVCLRDLLTDDFFQSRLPRRVEEMRLSAARAASSSDGDD